MQNLKNSTEKNIILLKEKSTYIIWVKENTPARVTKKNKCFAQELELENQTIKDILNELESEDWLSDQRFTEQFIFAKKGKYGAEKIRYELKNARSVMKTIINDELCQNKNQRVIRSQKKSGQRNLMLKLHSHKRKEINK